MIYTKEMAERYIDSFRSERGGWTKESLRHLGVSWPPKHGWRKKLILKITGREMRNEMVRE